MVTRDAVMAEGTAGGFGAVYPVFREMEERGRVRRGYFVEGLGGAQFARGRRGRPAARPGSGSGRPCLGQRAAGRSSWRPLTLPTRTVPRWPGRATSPAMGGRPAVPRAPTSCCTTATWRCTSSAAAARCSPSHRSMTTRWPRPRSRRSGTCSRTTGSAGSRSNASTGSRSSHRPTGRASRRWASGGDIAASSWDRPAGRPGPGAGLRAGA